jgi:hypothetical protein
MIWDFLEALPHINMTPTTYLICSAVAIFVGVFSLRGNPTKGA